MTKEQTVFWWSATRLRETTGNLYFWTFTFKRVHCAWHYSTLWHRFTEALQHVLPDDTQGIRVVQMHPGENGKGHGFHYHCLFNRWIDARRMWRLCRLHEMGCDAKKIQQKDWEAAVLYVARYLTRDAEPFPIRVRRSAALFGFPMDTINDCRTIHPNYDSFIFLRSFLGRRAVGADFVGRVFSSPNCKGDWRTLVAAIHYKRELDSEVFRFTHSRLRDLLNSSLCADWISEDSTIYNPGLLPVVFPEMPF